MLGAEMKQEPGTHGFHADERPPSEATDFCVGPPLPRSTILESAWSDWSSQRSPALACRSRLVSLHLKQGPRLSNTWGPPQVVLEPEVN